MIVSMFLSTPYCALDIFTTRKPVDYGGEYGLDIPAIFHFYLLDTVIRLTENKIKIEES